MKKFCIAIIILALVAAPGMIAQDFFGESAKIAFGFYHEVLSPLKNPVNDCQFTPSCSYYAQEAVAEYGFVVGSCLAADRLARCSYHARTGQYPKSGRKFYDPPAKNYVFGSGRLWCAGLSGSSGRKSPDSPGMIIPGFEFAYSLNQQGDFDNSILELKREQFQNPDKQTGLYAELLLAVNFIESGNTTKARYCLDRAERISNEDYKWRLFVLNFLVNDLDATDEYNVNNCNRALESFPEKSVEILRLRTMPQIKIHDYTGAESALNSMPDSGDSLLIRNALESLGKIKDFSGKSSFLAGALSAIIPGSGYIYCGDWGTGLSSLAVNALLGAGIYALVKNENYGSALLLGGISLPFYLGNIAGSANCAMAQNNKQLETLYLGYRKSLGIDFYFSLDFLNNCWKAE